MPEYLQNTALFTAVTAILGLMVGSFLNVVIHRLPIMLERAWRSQCAELLGTATDTTDDAPFNLATPRSRCPSCGHTIPAVENIPVLSYLWLRGRCSACGVRIRRAIPSSRPSPRCCRP